MLHYKALARSRLRKVTNVMLVIFGFVVMIGTTALTVKNWIYDKSVKTPDWCDEHRT